MTSSDPLISVIIVVYDDYTIFRKTVRHLREQTRSDQIELVVVTRSQSAPTVIEADFTPFHSYQIVRLDRIDVPGDGFAAGIRHAHASIVGMSEDHGYPNPGWAEALIAAHQHDYSAVGPAMFNANPDSSVSWANFFLCFVEWLDPIEGQEVESLAGHNTFYKRDVLLSFGADLAELLRSERTLHYKLVERHTRLYLEPGARITHINIAQFIPYLSASFNGGRIFGDLRSHDWSWPKRLLHVLATPLVPFIRLRRIHQAVVRAKHDYHWPFWQASGLMLLGLFAHAIGEAIGYTFGQGNSSAIYMNYELRRRDYVRPKDQWLFQDGIVE